MLSLLFLSFHEEKSFAWYLCFNNTITLTGSNSASSTLNVLGMINLPTFRSSLFSCSAASVSIRYKPYWEEKPAPDSSSS